MDKSVLQWVLTQSQDMILHYSYYYCIMFTLFILQIVQKATLELNGQARALIVKSTRVGINVALATAMRKVKSLLLVLL